MFFCQINLGLWWSDNLNYSSRAEVTVSFNSTQQKLGRRRWHVKGFWLRWIRAIVKHHMFGLPKTFDAIPHQRLLTKWRGIIGQVLLWIKTQEVEGGNRGFSEKLLCEEWCECEIPGLIVFENLIQRPNLRAIIEWVETKPFTFHKKRYLEFPNIKTACF